MNTIIDSDTLLLRDEMMPVLLRTLRKAGFKLVLFSSSAETITRGVLKELVNEFHHVLYKTSQRELPALGKNHEEMIFLSSNFSKLTEEWHLPLDVPICSQMLEIFTQCPVDSCCEEDLLSFSPLDEELISTEMALADMIAAIRSKWGSMRDQIQSLQKQLVQRIIRSCPPQAANASTSAQCKLQEGSIAPPPTLPLIPPTVSSHSLQMKYVPPSKNPQLPKTNKKMTIVLDLDGTLVHTHRCPMGLNVNIRPYARHFLNELASMKDRFEVVLYTAASQSYAEPIIRHIDSNRVIDHILHRSHCSKLNNHYVKELDRMGRQHFLIVDDNQFSFLLNDEDAIPVKCWVRDEIKDNELISVLNTIQNIYRDENLHNSRRHIRKYLTSQRTNSM
eukprot:CAMPEP_0117456298 /NCGR_PEP_ID=MMETSP0759-20121206/11804_1 /TAXON_ID=63605 /ORGANISM="Percolomonas cosmopolitus, Strain WS" /LENGTH=390 /DNA_ID=CAMNT_0005249631 /DNA_START=2131 /DNA_END=3303 /DNA_ORIENTATION=-